jgi:hypothetical protein
MSVKYEIVEDVYGKTIKRTNTDESETWIPTDPANSDYQRYLRWLEDPTAEEGGTL